MTGYFIVDLYTLVFYLIFIIFGVLWLKSGTHVCLAIVVQNMIITLGDWCFKNENCEYAFFFFKTGLALFIIHGWRPCLHTNTHKPWARRFSPGFVRRTFWIHSRTVQPPTQAWRAYCWVLGFPCPSSVWPLYSSRSSLQTLGWISIIGVWFFFGWSCARVKIGRVVMKKARE